MHYPQKSTSDSSRPVIRFLSCDRYALLQSHFKNLSQNTDCFSFCTVLDVTGENWNFSEFNASNKIVQFNHLRVIESIWQELKPHAKEWWDLLDLSEKEAFELPTLPGIDDLTRLIFIANHIESHMLGNQAGDLIVILPPGIKGIKLFEMMQQGPIIIENLLEPLLNWWDHTKQTLAAIETLMRLKLPSSKKLRFNEYWRLKFERTQDITSNRDRHQLVAILDCEGHNLSTISNKVSLYGMHSSIPSHLIMCGSKFEAIQCFCSKISSQWMQVMCWQTEQEDASTSKSLETHTGTETSRIDHQNMIRSYFMPCIDKKEMRIQQVDHLIFIFYHGYQRSINISDFKSGAICKNAQIDNNWLTLNFELSQ